MTLPDECARKIQFMISKESGYKCRVYSSLQPFQVYCMSFKWKFITRCTQSWDNKVGRYNSQASMC